MSILDKIEAVDIKCYCGGCKEPMKLLFAATKESNFELISAYCPKCLYNELDKKTKIITNA